MSCIKRAGYLLLVLFVCLSGRSQAQTYSDFEYTVAGNAVTLTGYTGTNEAVTIPSLIPGVGTVTSIGDNAFFNRSSLTSVTIPDSVISICNWAFYCCKGLTSITIPGGVTHIADSAFYYCTRLTSIEVDAQNTQYGSVAGVLFDKNMATVILYPAGKNGSYTIPNTVTNISNYAFSGCGDLTNVTISTSVISIGDFAFSGNGLTSVTIPSSVTTIGNWTFSNCSSLTSVYFQGNAPASFGSGVFDYVEQDFSIYYPSIAAGWTTPTWNGYPAQPYTLVGPPLVRIAPAAHPDFAFRLDCVGLVSNLTYQVQASSNLCDWNDFGAPFEATATTNSVNLAPETSHRFFRLLYLP